jgi:hypothetical protein
MSFTETLPMPQPINRIVRNPTVYLDANILHDKPEMAAIVCKILATWATIEREQSLLLVRVLGADAAPAIAMYQTLQTQRLQNVALQAAAKHALSGDDHLVFLAVISVLESTQTPRNHLAHWTWAGCKERPDLLALADPQMVRDRDFRVAKYYKQPRRLSIATMADDFIQLWNVHQFDDSFILGYSKDDLVRALRDLEEAEQCLNDLRVYLDPAQTINVGKMAHPDVDPEGEITPEVLKAHMRDRLSGKRLFREALDRLRKGQQTPPETPSSPPQSPGAAS